MTETIFPYPGGKTHMAPWIIDHFPDHHCYVEPFGGGASVMVNKPESSVEVYNDRDGDVVHFFRVLRERDDELVEWLRQRPYAKDLHEKYAHQFYNGYSPDDDVERAGRFFYLRRSQYAAKYTGFSGFRSSKERNNAGQYYDGAEELKRFAKRFRNVQVENRDYAEIFDRFDGPKTLFYLDPPYVSEGDALYSGDDFEHQRFISALNDLEAKWCASYTAVPNGLEYETLVEQEETQHMSKNNVQHKQTRTERLVMNYDLDKVPRFHRARQATLG